jgi:Uma2 family endonuclease
MVALASPPPSAVPLSAPRRRYTVAEYLEIERKTNQKHSFIDGFLFPMPGGTLPHSIIGGNVFGQIFMALKHKPNLRIFNSDTKIYIPQLGIYHYPDALVVAGTPVEAQEEVGAVTNPILIIEVLSDSTGRYDRGKKFTEYQTLPSFTEYVLIHQDRPQVDSFLRQSDPNLWRTSEVNGLGNEMHFQSIDVRLSLSDIYHNVSFETVE